LVVVIVNEVGLSQRNPPRRLLQIYKLNDSGAESRMMAFDSTYHTRVVT
jgi:hypothetical protein